MRQPLTALPSIARARVKLWGAGSWIDFGPQSPRRVGWSLEFAVAEVVDVPIMLPPFEKTQFARFDRANTEDEALGRGRSGRRPLRYQVTVSAVREGQLDNRFA